jgi:hypothetical protein
MAAEGPTEGIAARTAAQEALAGAGSPLVKAVGLPDVWLSAVRPPAAGTPLSEAEGLSETGKRVALSPSV